jgi:hypothetical protein
MNASLDVARTTVEESAAFIRELKSETLAR